MAGNAFRRLDTCILRGLCCLAIGLGLGCAKKAPPPELPAQTPAPALAPAPAPVKPVLVRTIERETAYDQGLRAYEAGELKRATSLWREACTAETDPAVRQKALFALAAVKLAQAGNDAELSTAMDLLEAWAKNSPSGGSGEDPRFVLPMLRSFKPGFAFKEFKTATEKECAKKLAEREEQVRRSLQQQVKALETIHREIQEKKKGLTNY